MSSLMRDPRQPGDRNTPGPDKGPVLRIPQPRSGTEWYEPRSVREPAPTSRHLRGRFLLTIAYVVSVFVLLLAMLDGRLG